MPFNPRRASLARSFQTRGLPLLGADPKLKDGRYQVFAAYPYNLDPDYRSMLLGLEAKARVKFRFLDDDLAATPFARKIRTRLKVSSLAIFDLSGWNANVSFEFGMCLGLVDTDLDRVWVLLDTTKSSDVPSDFQGGYQVRYRTLPELEERLETHLAKKFPLR